VDDSPITRLLAAFGQLDADAVAALLTQDGRLLTAHGRRAEGRDAVHDLLTAFLANLRSASYRITDQWRDGNVWIAEIEATYVLRDGLEMGPLARLMVLRDRADGIVDVRVYGANEADLADHRTGEEGMWIGERWIPPL
jgi:uncharacterized protein (TIGR02246 family)